MNWPEFFYAWALADARRAALQRAFIRRDFTLYWSLADFPACPEVDYELLATDRAEEVLPGGY